MSSRVLSIHLWIVCIGADTIGKNLHTAFDLELYWLIGIIFLSISYNDKNFVFYDVNHGHKGFK
jgi:hypothetical protein